MSLEEEIEAEPQDIIEVSDELDHLIAESLGRLVRGEKSSLKAFLKEIKISVNVDGTKCIGHCYFIDLDGNDRPKTKDFAKELVMAVVDYAIPRETIAKADEYDKKYNTKRESTRLVIEAKELFTELNNTGEGGELLLFVLAETYLQLPQILCKMDLKTSSNVHFHGADGIYAGVDAATKKLALYWGESKLYANIKKAVADCFASLSKILLSDGGTDEPAHRDLQLLTTGMKLASPELENAIKTFLDPKHENYRKYEFKGIALVGFNHASYPAEPNKVKVEELKTLFTNEMHAWLDSVKGGIDKQKLAAFEIHTFCIPFPSVADFRKFVLKELGKDKKETPVLKKEKADTASTPVKAKGEKKNG